MEQLTIGQIAQGATFIVGLISGIAFLTHKIRGYIADAIKPQLVEINASIQNLESRLDSVDLESCKNFLVSVIADIERHGQIDEVQKQRFYEQYEHYRKCGGNSYIRHKVEQLQSEGKL